MWWKTTLFRDDLKWKLVSCVRLFATPWTKQVVQGILQARILEWVAFPLSWGSSQPKDWTQVSHIVSELFTSWATREAQDYWSGYPIPSPADLPNLGIQWGSPALQVDSLPTELSEKPKLREFHFFCICSHSVRYKACTWQMHMLCIYLLNKWFICWINDWMGWMKIKPCYNSMSMWVSRIWDFILWWGQTIIEFNTKVLFLFHSMQHSSKKQN